jgi:uncharacterized OB-fold protein
MTTEPAATRAIPRPETNPETQPFWDAAAQGRFLVKRCLDCGQAHWYPRALCPFCFGSRTEWQDGSGRGTVYTFSVMRRAPVPYAVAYVTLEEGPTMLTNIVGCDFDRLRIGQAVQVCFSPIEGGGALPVFTPAAAAERN